MLLARRVVVVVVVVVADVAVVGGRSALARSLGHGLYLQILSYRDMLFHRKI